MRWKYFSLYCTPFTLHSASERRYRTVERYAELRVRRLERQISDKGLGDSFYRLIYYFCIFVYYGTAWHSQHPSYEMRARPMAMADAAAQQCCFLTNRTRSMAFGCWFLPPCLTAQAPHRQPGHQWSKWWLGACACCSARCRERWAQAGPSLPRHSQCLARLL